MVWAKWFHTWKMFHVTSNTVHVLLSFFPCVEEILSCDMIKCIMTYWMFDVHMKHFSCVHTNILMCWYLFYFSIKNNSLRSDNPMSPGLCRGNETESWGGSQIHTSLSKRTWQLLNQEENLAVNLQKKIS